MGQAQAATGASSVQATGSPLSVMHDIASQGELSRRLTIWKGQQQATGALGQGAIDEATGEAQQKAAQISGVSTLLTAADKAAEQAFAVPGT